jgi:hypothetical protein
MTRSATAAGLEYTQQCVARATVQSDTILNVALAPLSNLAVEPSRTTSTTFGSRTISGVVYEATSQGCDRSRTSTSAGSTFSTSSWQPREAYAAGRYLLCGPAGRIEALFAVKDGYDVTIAAVDSDTDVLDVEIKPR